MKRRYIITEEIESPNKIGRKLDAFNFFFILAYIAVSFGLMQLVAERLHLLFIIFSGLIALFLSSKSHFNRHRRNYESLLLLSYRNLNIYKPVYEEALDEREE